MMQIIAGNRQMQTAVNAHVEVRECYTDERCILAGPCGVYLYDIGFLWLQYSEFQMSH